MPDPEGFAAYAAAHLNSLDGDIVLAMEAKQIEADTSPADFKAWLWESRQYLLARYLGDLLRTRRHHARSRERFAQAAGEAEGGDTQALRTIVDEFDARVCVDRDGNIWRPVGDMNGKDHRRVADFYGEDEHIAGLLRQFHLAVAKRVGRRTTRDVLTVEQYRSIREMFLPNQ